MHYASGPWSHYLGGDQIFKAYVRERTHLKIRTLKYKQHNVANRLIEMFSVDEHPLQLFNIIG